MIDDSSIPAMIFNTLDMDCSSHAQERATHRAVTTHCTRTGFLFEEMHHSHGKMIVRPALTSYIMSPHRLNQPHVEWPDDGLKSGTFRHFNRFRYSREAMATGARRSVEQLDWNSVADTFARRLRNAVSSAETLRRARDDAF